MTTEPNGIVEPIHEKARPVFLMTPDDVEQWLRGSTIEDALKMQKPAPDEAIVMRPEEKKVA
jgi:putative SOS response-associated peptidase YedK